MKILFFIALLMNIIFFLWEFNSGTLNSPVDIADAGRYKTKQILLVSELPDQDEGDSFKIVENNFALYDPIVSLELYSATNSKKEEPTKESSEQLIESSTITIEESSENLISSDELLQNDQGEQNSWQHDTDNLATNDQGDSVQVIPGLEGKLLTGESQEEIVVNSLLNSDESSIETDEQVDSLTVLPVLEEKHLTGENQEEAVVDNVLNNDEAQMELTAPVNNYCYHVGPFTSRNALKVWRELNKIDTDSVNRFNKESDVVSSYLVYFPAAETYAQSRENVQQLKQKGITDYWLFRRGELKGAISLGLFIKKDRALLLQEKLVKAGLTIEIKERYKTEQLLFAEILTEDKAFKDTVIILGKQAVSRCKNNTW